MNASARRPAAINTVITTANMATLPAKAVRLLLLLLLLPRPIREMTVSQTHIEHDGKGWGGWWCAEGGGQMTTKCLQADEMFGNRSMLLKNTKLF